jgi:hypothetical protein
MRLFQFSFQGIQSILAPGNKHQIALSFGVNAGQSRADPA